MGALKTGVMLTADYPPKHLIQLARLIEELGYDYLWHADQRFLRDCYSGLTNIALNTSKLTIGPGVNDPYSRHPALTAMAIGTLDELSGGRAVLGLGAGYSGLRAMGMYKGNPVAALREAVQVVRAMLRGETAECHGRVIELAPSALGFPPVRNHIPIYIVTQGDQISELAGEVADGVLLGNTSHPPLLRHMIRKVAAGVAKARRPLGSIDIGLRLEACVSEDRAAAFVHMKPSFMARMVMKGNTSGLAALGVEPSEEFLRVWSSNAPDRVERATQLLPDVAIERSMLVGPWKEAAESLARALLPEITHVTMRPFAHAGRRVEDTIIAFAERIVPAALTAVGRPAP